MLSVVIYYLFLFGELIVSASLAIYLTSLVYSFLKGAPYVPTNSSEVVTMLQNIEMKPGQLFFELGSGDGRVVRSAVKNFGVKGIGVDINPILTFWANLLARWEKLTNIQFLRADIFSTDLHQADIIYLYLLPQMLEKLKTQLTEQTKPGAIIVSYTFRIPYLQQYRVKTHTGRNHPTYIYRVPESSLFDK